MTLAKALEEYEELIVIKGNKVVIPSSNDYRKNVHIFPLTPTTMAAKITE